MKTHMLRNCPSLLENQNVSPHCITHPVKALKARSKSYCLGMLQSLAYCLIVADSQQKMTLGWTERKKKRLHASTHLSQMGKEGNALYCLTKSHFIGKNAINTLEKKYTQLTPLTLHYTGFNLLPKRTTQNVRLVQTKVTRDTQLQHYYYCNDSFCQFHSYNSES